MENLSHETRTLIMSPQEEGDLWRKRFFEAQAGMELYLMEEYGQEEIAKWMPVKAEIMQGLEVQDPGKDNPGFWKERFFRTQARLEKYLAQHHGLQDLDRWTKAIAKVFRLTEPNRGGGAEDFARRFAKQAHCYRSDYEISDASQQYARVVLNHCAIWDYRELARSRGVQLTLESPCTYCTKATMANAGAKGFRATFSLHDDERGHGCTWEIEAASPKLS